MTAFPPALMDESDLATMDDRNAPETVCDGDSSSVDLPIPFQDYRYTADEVAALRADKIFVMSRPELIGVLRSVRGSHLRPGVLDRLPQMDGETLRKLVFLTRRFCRNQQTLAAPLATSCGAGARSW